MSARAAVALLCVVACAVGCAKPASITSDPPTTSNSHSATAPSAKPEEIDRWRCHADDDCTMSCAYGAVARRWGEANVFQECKDGCASKGIVARCRDGACTAYRDGAPYDGCSGSAPDAPKKGM